MVRQIAALLFVFTLCPLATGTAVAAPITFLDRAAFDLAIGTHATITFDDASGGAVCEPVTAPVTDPCRATFGGVEFVSAALPPRGGRPELFVDEGLGAASSKQLTSSEIPTRPGDFYALYGGTVIGFDIVAAGASTPVSIELTLTNGTALAYSMVAGPSIPTFFGIELDAGEISRVSWWTSPAPRTGSIANFAVDNLSVRPVPEPASMALFASGLAVLTARVRARRTRST